MVATAKGELWPSIQFGINQSSTGGTADRLAFTIGNFGTGPAIVHSVYLQFEGDNLSDYAELLNQLTVVDSVKQGFSYSKLSERVIPAGEAFEFFKLDDNPVLSAALHQALTDDKLRFTLYYKSVFDDYWVTVTDYTQQTVITKEVNESEIPANQPIFRQ